MKALVLSSGGIDSTTCLSMAVKKYGKENVMTLSVFYGQKHTKELVSARQIAAYYEVLHEEMDLSKVFAESDCSLLTHSDKEIPKESYAKQLEKNPGTPVSTYVPFRNGLFLSVAASVAISYECKVLYYGAHADDAAGSAYPDCSEAFHQAMSQAIYLGSGNRLWVEAPLINMTKAEVVKLGLELKAPFEMTWSCYEGEDRPCGKCGTCLDRQKAFVLNGVEDPVMKVHQEN